MTTFITGATGLIGSHISKALTDKGERVVVLVRDVFPSKWYDEALKDCIKVKGDITDIDFLKRVMTQYEVKHVFHFAALAQVKTAFKAPVNVYETNVMGTVNILEVCRQIDIDRALVMITDKVYGERENAKPHDPLEASEPYATSKISAQYVCQSYMKTYGVDIVIPRGCNVYGFDYANRIIPNTIRAALRGESARIFTGESNTIRQYINVFDLIDALNLLMNQTSKRKLEGYNICTMDVLNQEEVVLKILTHFPHIKPTYARRQTPPGEIQRQTMVLSDFGWQPRISFEEGIRDTIERFRFYV